MIQTRPRVRMCFMVHAVIFIKILNLLIVLQAGRQAGAYLHKLNLPWNPVKTNSPASLIVLCVPQNISYNVELYLCLGVKSKYHSSQLRQVQYSRRDSPQLDFKFSEFSQFFSFQFHDLNLYLQLYIMYSM